MKKCSIQNIEMIASNKCNLNCAHCLRGQKNEQCMNQEVIDATFDQICHIVNLGIGGGEPTIAIDTIERIIKTIIDKRILLEKFSLTINGTIYSEELIRLLNYINDYINCFHFMNKNNIILGLSIDKYHLAEIKRLNYEKEYLNNIEQYKKSGYLREFRDITKKIFREGNAKLLDENITIPLPKMPIIMTYVNKNKFDRENGLCNIGPLITINPEGTITECNASIEHMNTLYNYGNVLTDSIEEVCLRNGAEVVEPKLFNKQLKKIINDYVNY